MTDEDVPFVRDPEDPNPEIDSRDAADEAPALPPPIPEPEPEREPSFLGKSWPIFAAAFLIAATLFAVFSLLHPRRRPDTATAVAGVPAFVTVESVEIRREASATSESLASLEQGDKVETFGASGTWLEVESKDGKRGYLPVDAVERASERDARSRREKTLLAFAPVYGVVGEAADIILAPYPLAPRAGRIAKGTVIAIHSVDHSYFGFKDKTWGIAFVGSAAVDLIPPDPREPAIEPEKVKALKNLTIIDLEGEPPPEDAIEDLASEGESENSAERPGSAQAPAPAPATGAPAAPAAGIVEAATVAKRVEPVYPDLARRAGIEGTVELEVSIDATGAVTDVEVVRGLPLGLSEAASDAVHKWTYKPARTAAGPVASRRSVRIRFLLRAE